MRNDIKYMAGNDLDICGDRIGVVRGYGEPCDMYRMRLIETLDRREGGGSAFGELRRAGECSVKTGGVTLRDYFASKAMQGMLANGDWVTNMVNATGQEADEVVGIAAYEIADAMLRERAK